MKTIFYKISENQKGDYWFNSVPYNEWFILEKTLYEPNGNIRKRTIIKDGEKKCVKDIVIITTEDTFSDYGIIRRIAVLISN